MSNYSTDRYNLPTENNTKNNSRIYHNSITIYPLIRSSINRHHLTDCLEILEAQGIESETALEMLPMMGGVK